MKPGPSTLWRVILAVAAVVFVYLALRTNRTALPSWYVDGVAHALLNFAIGLVVYKAFAPGRAFWWALAGLVAFGGIVEWLQGFTPGRAPEFADFLANVVGVVPAGLVAALAWRLRRAPPEPPPAG